MEGWKTKVGGGLAIAVGVCGYALTLLGMGGLDATTALGFVGAGFTALGLGHKFDKVRQALEAARK